MTIVKYTLYCTKTKEMFVQKKTLYYLQNKNKKKNKITVLLLSISFWESYRLINLSFLNN